MFDYFKIYIILKTSFRSLLQHKLRSALSIIGIICGTMAVLTMLSIGEGARQKIISQIGQLGIRNIFIKSIPLTEVQKQKASEHLSPGLNADDAVRIIKGIPYVRTAACVKEVKAAVFSAGAELSPQILQTSPEYADVLNLSVQHGRFISETDMIQKNPICIIGAGLAENMGVEGNIGRTLRIENRVLSIIGILNPFYREREGNTSISVRNYNEIIFIPPDILDTENDLTEIVVQIKETEQVIISGKIIKRIMEVAHHQVEDYQIIIPREILRQAQKTRRTFSMFLSAVAGISLLVGGIGIMNIMLAGVSERTKEIGIRRAVGATKKDIIFQFLAESVILTSLGGSAGILLGAAAAKCLSAVADWDTVITFFSVFLPLLMSVFIGVFFGLYPAWQAACMDPVTALRNE